MLESKRPPATIFRLARKPDPWQPSDWARANPDGTFGNRGSAGILAPRRSNLISEGFCPRGWQRKATTGPKGRQSDVQTRPLKGRSSTVASAFEMASPCWDGEVTIGAVFVDNNAGQNQ